MTLQRRQPSLHLNRVLINESQVIPSPDLGQPLVIGPGQHRLDFDFSCSDAQNPELD